MFLAVPIMFLILRFPAEQPELQGKPALRALQVLREKLVQQEQQGLLVPKEKQAQLV